MLAAYASFLLLLMLHATHTCSEDALHSSDQTISSKSTHNTTNSLKTFTNNGKIGIAFPDGVPCLMAQLEARLVIRQLGTVKKISDDTESILYIPSHHTVFGKCATNVNDKSELTIVWATDDGGKYELSHSFAAEKVESSIKSTWKWTWKLKNATLAYFPPIEKEGKMVTCYMTNKSQIWAPLKQSFLCKHALNITLINNPAEQPCDVIVQYKANMQILAYNLDKSNDFGNTYLCDRSKEIGILTRLKSSSTVSCGFVLGACAVATIIGHSVKRHWSFVQQPYFNLE
ncbi:hypothetical protein T05_16056 [Trichinella murrelli]|uniref:Ig-like domain-containing protein n=1 Tax=Trichinella murrelli TaxID=144512 RepID=A0A0V0TGU1_9BILA|nr:hypothetical protein T05_16056 [Trichinella murrelli]